MRDCPKLEGTYNNHWIQLLAIGEFRWSENEEDSLWLHSSLQGWTLEDHSVVSWNNTKVEAGELQEDEAEDIASG